MDQASAGSTVVSRDEAWESPGRIERTFSISMLVSAARCSLTYVVLPFLAPILGFAPGVGPALAMPIAAVAIGANVISVRRFWRVQHPWRKPITVLHVSVIGLLLVLIAGDIADLIS